jgi:hypothetical protein
MSATPPLSVDKQTSGERTATAAFDPIRTGLATQTPHGRFLFTLELTVAARHIRINRKCKPYG